jgi:RNA polymerase sigma factor (sigma-70 family)
MAAETANAQARPGSRKSPRQAHPSGAPRTTARARVLPTVRGAGLAGGAVAAACTFSLTDPIAARDDLPIIDLVARAKDGDPQAWNALVERYARLVWSICRQYRLDSADAEDVAQNVWLRLVDRLDGIRDPAAIASWLATTTRRECCQMLRTARRPQAAWPGPDAEAIPDEQARTAEQELLAAERHAALREALAHLTPRDQQLLAILTADPAVPYAEISARLGIPVGSIGPTRGRCLDKLRRYPAIAGLINAEAQAQAA